LDLIISPGLPWRKLSDKNDVRDVKIRCRQAGTREYEAFYNGLKECRAELVKILNYLDGLDYVESKFLAFVHYNMFLAPDYEFIYKMLREAAAKCNVNLDVSNYNNLLTCFCV
jgi:hypothetical protein